MTLHQAGQQAQHTTNELFQPLVCPCVESSSNPTHYQQAIPAPDLSMLTKFLKPNTLPTSYSDPGLSMYRKFLKPNTLPTGCSSPWSVHAYKVPQTQHTTNKLFQPLACPCVESSLNPTHYQQAVLACLCIESSSNPTHYQQATLALVCPCIESSSSLSALLSFQGVDQL